MKKAVLLLAMMIAVMMVCKHGRELNAINVEWTIDEDTQTEALLELVQRVAIL